MIGDKLGKPIEAGQVIVCDTNILGIKGMLECRVINVSELLLPERGPMKTISMIAEFRLNVPVEAAAIGGFYIVQQASEEDRKMAKSLIEVPN